MADEITVSGSLGAIKGTISKSPGLAVVGLTPDMSGDQVHSTYQSVGTSEEAVALGDFSTGGWMMLVNRDGTNFITVKGSSGATAFAKMLPGEFVLMRCIAAAPYVQADTAACLMEIFIVEA